jgi:hypothetical protein
MMSLKNTNIDRAKDTGLAMVLILLIIEYIRHPDWLVICAMVALVLTMIWPPAFKPLAKVWFGFSHLLGTVVSKIILSIVFFLIVTPMGLIRKAFGADPMKCRQWKKDDESVLVDRNHLYTKKDIEKPY